ncbi:MAG: OprD family outer membrane porin [Cytophagales bacterium]|nr:OprD family outer membrane porin [Bernardetiaceae bacterium]MDW8211389.1 OprD family outer membrane porin [Cytophagales bacterium]
MCRNLLLAAVVWLMVLQHLIAQHATSDSTSHSAEEEPILHFPPPRNEFRLEVRNFFSSTINYSFLPDYIANGVSIALDYHSPSWHGFSFAFGGALIENPFHTKHIWEKDSLTGQHSRYESELFDLTQPYRHSDLTLMEEMFVRYTGKKFTTSLGNLLLKTPFINPQDGRLRPTMVRGFWTEMQLAKKLFAEAGWITHVAPRSTTEWFKIGESVGVYWSGLAPNGQLSNYRHHIKTKGVGMAALIWKDNESKVQLWNTFFENVTNTLLLQADFPLFHTPREAKCEAGVQLIRQDVVGQGGNAQPGLAYAEKGKYSQVLSTRIIYRTGRHYCSLAYTNINGTTRFLMPREWGREPFYTFMERERNEGLRSANAYMAEWQAEWLPKCFQTSIALGYYNLPSVHNSAYNKYQMPSFAQLNVELNYRPKFLKGVSLQALYVYKRAMEMEEIPIEVLHNRANMHLINLVLRYVFVQYAVEDKL